MWPVLISIEQFKVFILSFMGFRMKLEIISSLLCLKSSLVILGVGKEDNQDFGLEILRKCQVQMHQYNSSKVMYRFQFSLGSAKNSKKILFLLNHVLCTNK